MSNEHHITLIPNTSPDVLCTAEVEGFKAMVIESLDAVADEVTIIEPDGAEYDVFIVIPMKVMAAANGAITELITTLIATAHRNTL